MGPQKRETVLVILHLLHRDIPPLHGVALLAIRSHLPTMNIRVTIRAVLSHIREYRLYMALHALHFFVHSPQRIICLVVVEFRDSPDGTPTRRRVTVLARNCQRAVRAARCLFLGVAVIYCGNMSRQP